MHAALAQLANQRDSRLSRHEIRRDHDDFLVLRERISAAMLLAIVTSVGRALARDLRGAVREHRGGHPGQLQLVRVEFAREPIGLIVPVEPLSSSGGGGASTGTGAASEAIG